MNITRKPRVALIMGDAAGIGPEIVAKSLVMEETRRICIPAVVGDARVMTHAVTLTKVPLKIVIHQNGAPFYHDQGQIAMKLLGFDRGATIAGGHLFPLTTPAHGTAFDIAGTGIADIGAFQAALRIAVRMAKTDKNQ